jgi:hypothetical protein
MTPAPRDDARNLAEAVATQQHTLNRALGGLGGKQKSWMNPNQPNTSSIYSPFPTEPRVEARASRPAHQPSASVQNPTSAITWSPPSRIPPPIIAKRLPGRPPKYPAPSSLDPTQAPQDRTTVELSRERYPPSNSTSPHLANVVSSGQGSVLLHANTVLPSPSPSPDITTESNVINPTHLPATSNIDGPRASGATSQEATSPQYHVSDLPLLTELRQAEAVSKRRAETNEIQTNKRSRLQLQTEKQTPQSAQFAQIQSGGQRRSSLGQVLTRPTSTDQVQSRSPSIDQLPFNYPSPHQPQQGMQNRAQTGRTPPQVQAPFGSPRALSFAVGQQPHGSPAGNHAGTFQAHSPIISSPLAPTDYFSQTDCHRAFSLFYQMHYSQQGGPVPQSHDEQRLAVLKEAVERQDWDYLTMHQYYCLLNTHPQSLPPNILNHPSMKSAIALMVSVLDKNEKLSPVLLDFFVNFPMSIHQIALKWPRMHHFQDQRFFRFVVLSANFEAVKNICVQRKYPPIVRELHQDLGIASFLFQRIVFTAIIRRIWASSYAPTRYQKQFEDEALFVLTQNQQDFVRTSSSNISPNFNDEHWAGRLKGLCAEHEQRLRSMSQLQQTRPVLPNHYTQASALDHMQPQTAQAAIARGRGLPRTSGPHQPQLMLPPNHVQAAQRGGNLPFLPGPTYVQPQQREPNPTRFGLHQAYLRSPVLKAEKPGLALYQYVKAFAKTPARFKDAGKRVERWSLPVRNMNTIPKNVPGLTGEPGWRVVNEESNILRLRCVKWPSSKDENPNEHEWAIADTCWPLNTYFTFNGTPLHPRKKLHHGKDLPIDISSLIKEGDNTLEIAVLRQANDERYSEYCLAIEVVGFETHDAIKQACLTSNYVPASKTLEAIKRKLSGTDDDDEIAIVASNLTIQLFDPFSASKICDIPARSKDCLHFDCFDLETFLQTRPRKGDSSVVDHWRCPICSEDARPQNLIVDGFLQDVRKQLEYNGLLETRAVIMDQDGSWKPRVETLDPNGVRDQSEEDDRSLAQRTVPAQVKKAPIEIIDLSD